MDVGKRNRRPRLLQRTGTDVFNGSEFDLESFWRKWSGRKGAARGPRGTTVVRGARSMAIYVLRRSPGVLRSPSSCLSPC